MRIRQLISLGALLHWPATGHADVASIMQGKTITLVQTSSMSAGGVLTKPPSQSRIQAYFGSEGRRFLYSGASDGVVLAPGVARATQASKEPVGRITGALTTKGNIGSLYFNVAIFDRYRSNIELRVGFVVRPDGTCSGTSIRTSMRFLGHPELDGRVRITAAIDECKITAGPPQ